MAWFATLPLWLDLGDLRVVHACWHEKSMKMVERQLGSTHFAAAGQIVDASTKGYELYEAVEVLLKGPEISLTARNYRGSRTKTVICAAQQESAGGTTTPPRCAKSPR